MSSLCESHDLTMKKIQQRMDERARRWDGEGLTYEERLQRIVTEEADPPADGMFPVDARWREALPFPTRRCAP